MSVGRASAACLEEFGHLAGAFITGEDPPQASNRISLHPTERDAYGLAVPVLTYSMHPNSTAMWQHAIDQTRAVYESIGGTRVVGTASGGSACHNMGVARMSADAENGVTNRWGQVHDVPNLFVSDGSVFTTSAAANPTLTIVALAIRQATQIADRMRRGEL